MTVYDLKNPSGADIEIRGETIEDAINNELMRVRRACWLGDAGGVRILEMTTEETPGKHAYPITVVVRHEGLSLVAKGPRQTTLLARERPGRGRPEVGPAVQVRLETELLAAVDREAARDGKSRAHVIRDLISEGLETRAVAHPD